MQTQINNTPDNNKREITENKENTKTNNHLHLKTTASIGEDDNDERNGQK